MARESPMMGLACLACADACKLCGGVHQARRSPDEGVRDRLQGLRDLLPDDGWPSEGSSASYRMRCSKNRARYASVASVFPPSRRTSHPGALRPSGRGGSVPRAGSRTNCAVCFRGLVALRPMTSRLRSPQRRARPWQFARCLGVIRNTSDQLKGHAITPPSRRWKLLIGCAQSGWPNLDSRSYASCELSIFALPRPHFFWGTSAPRSAPVGIENFRVELPCGRGAAFGSLDVCWRAWGRSNSPILPPNSRRSYRGLISVELWTLAAHPGLSGRQPAHGQGRARPRSRE